MKKIGIVTWHSIPNHGGMLQMLALTNVLKSLDLSPVVILHKITLERNDSSRSIKRYCSASYWEGFINNRFGRRLNEVKDEKMLDFQNETFITQSSVDDLDAVCIGSDEVFSLTNGFTPEFFGENIAAPVFSYAGSFGQTNIEIIKLKKLFDRISGDFSRFLGISVRDSNSLNILKSMGYDYALQHIDPVLLYGFRDEIDFENCKTKPQMLLYSYDGNMNTKYERQHLKKFCRRNNCISLSAGFYHFWCDKKEVFYPVEILSEFAKSKYVVTDTFHGAVISIITHSQFVVLVRSTNSNKITSLLRSLGLEDRIINDINDIEDCIKKPIDYDDVEEKLRIYREQSIDYLKKCKERLM